MCSFYCLLFFLIYSIFCFVFLQVVHLSVFMFVCVFLFFLLAYTCNWCMHKDVDWDAEETYMLSL